MCVVQLTCSYFSQIADFWRLFLLLQFLIGIVREPTYSVFTLGNNFYLGNFFFCTGHLPEIVNQEEEEMDKQIEKKSLLPREEKVVED